MHRALIALAMLCALVVSTGAQADPRWGHGWGHHGYNHGWKSPVNPWGGFLGGMVGGWLGSQLSREKPSRDDYEALEPWSREWFAFCSRRYRSFDPESGTYLSYDGERRFCK